MGDRFWSKVERHGEDECWRWTAQINELGYGCYWLNGKNTRAHRVAWELTHGPIPDGMVVRHRCQGKCVNPNHLELGTRSENQMDRVRDGTSNRGERHGMSKLSEHQVRMIKQRRDQSASALAREFGVGRSTIGSILNGTRWGWVRETTPQITPEQTSHT